MKKTLATAQKPDFKVKIGNPVKSSDLNQIADYLRKQMFVNCGNSVVFSMWCDSGAIKGTMKTPSVHIQIKNERGKEENPPKQSVAMLHFPCLNNGMSFANGYKASTVTATVTTRAGDTTAGGVLQMITSTQTEKPGTNTRKPSTNKGILPSYVINYPGWPNEDLFEFEIQGEPGDVRLDFLPPDEI